MAKDRRRTSPKSSITKTQFILRLTAFGVALLAIVAVIAIVWLLRDDRETDGTPVDPETTRTTIAAQTTTTAPSTTASVLTTVTTVLPSTTVTTTTAVPVTTAPTSPPSYPADGTWNLRLVNQWSGMTQAESETLPIAHFKSGVYIDSRIIEPLNAMLRDASQYGLWVTSGYRAYSLQEQLYNNKVQRVMNEQDCSYEEALEIAATEVARPGTSEHNTGLAVDLLYTGVWELEEYWEDGEVFDWLMAHCHEYGFILRFPKGKQDITGVIYEPWHYRYVGVEAATEIMSRGITLEEYLQEKGLYEIAP